MIMGRSAATSSLAASFTASVSPCGGAVGVMCGMRRLDSVLGRDCSS